MKVEIIDSHHSVMVDGTQIDIVYNFKLSTLIIFIDGDMKAKSNYNPSRNLLSYPNIIEVATYHYDLWNKEKVKKLNDL